MLTTEKYDYTYPKQTMATVVGIGMLVFYFITLAFPLSLTKDDIFLYSLPIRIGCSIWAYRMAKEMNRDAVWAISAFFLSSLTLIIMGQLRKLNR